MRARRICANVLVVWWLMAGWGSAMHVSDLHPDPFDTWKACNDFRNHITQAGRGGWSLHCEEGP